MIILLLFAFLTDIVAILSPCILPGQGEHVVQLKFMDGNLELYAFTFG